MRRGAEAAPRTGPLLRPRRARRRAGLGDNPSVERPGGGPTDFTNLGLLVTLCNLSSLLPLLALGLLDEVPQPPPEDGADADVIDHEGASAAPTAALQTGSTARVSASGAVNPSSAVSDEQAVEER